MQAGQPVTNQAYAGGQKVPDKFDSEEVVDMKVINDATKNIGRMRTFHIVTKILELWFIFTFLAI